MLTNKLCNPTPFEVDWNWDKGIHIKIKPDGSYNLTNQQLVDFQPGQPGSENIKQLMDELGIFLLDGDRTYEVQALECLRVCYRFKMAHYNDATNNIRRSRASAGIVDNADALEETFRQLGLSGSWVDKDGVEHLGIREQAERLQRRIKLFEEAVQEQNRDSKASDFDPDRTLIFVDPPKVFETAFALKVFLSEPENKELKVKYDTWRVALDR